MKKCISFILAFVFVIGISASTPITFTAKAASAGALTFELSEDGNSYAVTKCSTGATGVVTVPAVYEGKPITIIDRYAFSDCQNITEIKLPDTITEIGLCAFKDCKKLKTINYPKSLIEASNDIFSGCESLKSITVPEGIKEIPASMFWGARYLTEINLPVSLEKIGSRAFQDCEGLTELKLSDNITEIGLCAFQDCKNLKTINYPKSLIEASNDIFSGCESLKSITVPEGIKEIPASMFWGATYLTEINLPVSLEKIGSRAFQDCQGLTEIKLPLSLTEVDLAAFQGCINLKTVTYQGFAEQWKNIDISNSNEPLTSATIVCLDHTHSYTETVLKQPTCTEKGEKAYVCECGYTYTGDIKALGHNYSKDFTVDKQPTYQEAGSKSRHCTRCSAKTDVTAIAKLVLGVPVVTPKNTANGIEVKWSAIKDAEKYIVYSSTYSTKNKKWSSWKNRGTVTTTNWTDTTVKSGTKYKYTVKTVNGSVKGEHKSSSSILYLAQPTVKIANASTGVKVSWNKITGATGYKIYRAEYVNGKWTGWKSMGALKSTKTSWTDKSVKSGVKYKYTVKAVNGKTGSTYKSSSSLLYLAQPSVTVKAVSNGVKVTWTQITGATSYKVYRSEYNTKTKKWSSWKSIKTAKSTSKSYTDKSTKKGVKYRYAVKAVNGKVASTYKASSSVKR